MRQKKLRKNTRKMPGTAPIGRTGHQARFRKLLSAQRLAPSKLPQRDPSAEALSDRARIIMSTAFRRMQTKAQVFSLERNAAVRTRLTHTLEVAMYGEEIAAAVFQQLIKQQAIEPDLHNAFVTTVGNAGLLHDIGNPPFGHLGEFAIRHWFVNHAPDLTAQWSREGVSDDAGEIHIEGFRNFDGNAQTLRVVTRLQWFTDPHGLNPTYALLGTLIKYLSSSTNAHEPFRKKIGFFETELNTLKNAWTALGLKVEAGGLGARHPLVFLMEAADDIAYALSDIEDALEKEVVTQAQVLDELPKTLAAAPQKLLKIARRGPRNAAFRAMRIGAAQVFTSTATDAFVEHLAPLLDGTHKRPLLEEEGSDAYELLLELKRFAKRNIFMAPEAVDVELSGFHIVQGLFDAFKPLLMLGTDAFRRLDPRTADQYSYAEKALERRLYSLLPQKHRLAFGHAVTQAPALEPIFRTYLLCDFISGMTDSYALRVHETLQGSGGSNLYA